MGGLTGKAPPCPHTITSHLRSCTHYTLPPPRMPEIQCLGTSSSLVTSRGVNRFKAVPYPVYHTPCPPATVKLHCYPTGKTQMHRSLPRKAKCNVALRRWNEAVSGVQLCLLPCLVSTNQEVNTAATNIHLASSKPLTRW